MPPSERKMLYLAVQFLIDVYKHNETNRQLNMGESWGRNAVKFSKLATRNSSCANYVIKSARCQLYFFIVVGITRHLSFRSNEQVNDASGVHVNLIMKKQVD